MPTPKPKPQTVVRDSGTGRFVPRRQAITRPKTTETEVIRRPAPRKKQEYVCWFDLPTSLLETEKHPMGAFLA